PARERRPSRRLLRKDNAVTVLAENEHRDSIGMSKPRDRAALAQQARARGDAELGADQLERDLAIELRIVRGVDHAHRTAANRLEDEVAADRCAAPERRCDYR